MNKDSALWYTPANEIARVLEEETLWEERTYLLWLPDSQRMVRTTPEQVRPLSATASGESHIRYVASAARIRDALTKDLLLAPIESSVIPLPHQLHALSRSLEADHVRYLLADEVGLGKTIEAGLILRELKLRGLVRRTLVVAPKGLVTQWVAEMETHFGESFHHLSPGDASAFRGLGDDNPWRLFDQVVVSMDAVKPVSGRRGWSKQQLANYNRERFEELIGAGWELIIVDEAHRLGGSHEQVARFQLGQGLSGAAPYLLLLSATPHQGKSDAFYRLLSLLDPLAFPDRGSVTRERVQPYIIRTEKRRAIDAEGHPLFKPRRTQLIPVGWEPRHRAQTALYEAVTDYVREGYNQAKREKKNYLGFLMILMQRLVTSSTRAIQATLERRLEVLSAPEEPLPLFTAMTDDEWEELDGQTQVENLVAQRRALHNEREEVEQLLALATEVEARGPDAKTDALLEWILRLQREENDPNLKVLLFTEFVPTQEMLAEHLRSRGITVATLNGAMSMEERQQAQRQFAGPARVLVSTDAGGEGLNLQFAHVVVNYDIPWNPMRIEQRIGRVDRIGQRKVVRALNFMLAETVEYRVQEVLEQKLRVILDEFGVDKTSDVLDSAEVNRLFDELYVDSLLDPERLHQRADEIVREVREQALAVREASAIFGERPPLDPDAARKLMEHPIGTWIEGMVVSYLRARDGVATRAPGGWMLKWPDDELQDCIVFTAQEAQENPTATHLSLEQNKLQTILRTLPEVIEGQPLPVLAVPDLPPRVAGIWSLWLVSLLGTDTQQERLLPLFLHDNDAVYLPTAHFVWDQLVAGKYELTGYIDEAPASDALTRSRTVAEQHGRSLYDELRQRRQALLHAEREKGKYAFKARRQAIERLGLPAVRAHRLAALAEEEQAWLARREVGARSHPALKPLLVVRVKRANVEPGQAEN